MGSSRLASSPRKRLFLLVWIVVLLTAPVIFKSQYVATDLPPASSSPVHSTLQGGVGAEVVPSDVVDAHNNDVDPSTASTPVDVGSGSASCGRHRSCLDCLFRSTSSSPSDVCVWCASSRTCVAAAADRDARCPDLESSSCPAVLHTPIPQRLRVIHVAIRKGGPEALIQLHLALNHWGFRTTLDTRRSKKQKGGPVVPFFTEMYADEFAKAPPLHWAPHYDGWLDSAVEGDVMIATETWACRNEWAAQLQRGARQMQWHLTVWPKKPRPACTIAAHTNYIAQEYMWTPRRAVLFPYISPHIVRLATQRAAASTPAARSEVKRKARLVMYDGDVKLTDDDVKLSTASARAIRRVTAAAASDVTPWAVQKATGFTPQALYDKYAEASVGIDLVLPGAERFVYEASLFDVCIIVDRTANGADPYDLPLPDRFRVAPGNLTALHERIAECLDRYDDVMAEQRPLKENTLRQRVRFLRHVRRYFSNSVHVVTFFRTTAEAEQLFAAFVLHALMALPFAAIEIRHAAGVQFPAEAVKLLRENSYLAAVTFVELKAATSPSEMPFRPALASPKRTAFVLIAPPTTLVVGGDTMHIAASAIALGASTFTAARQKIIVMPSSQHEQTTNCFGKADFEAVMQCAVQTTASFDFDTVAGDLPRGTPALEALRRRNADAVLAVSADRSRAGGGAATTALLKEAGIARSVDAGAGDDLTVLQYQCSHPLFAKLWPGVCAAE